MEVHFNDRPTAKRGKNLLFYCNAPTFPGNCQPASGRCFSCLGLPRLPVTCPAKRLLHPREKSEHKVLDYCAECGSSSAPFPYYSCRSCCGFLLCTNCFIHRTWILKGQIFKGDYAPKLPPFPVIVTPVDNAFKKINRHLQTLHFGLERVLERLHGTRVYHPHQAKSDFDYALHLIREAQTQSGTVQRAYAGYGGSDRFLDSIESLEQGRRHMNWAIDRIIEKLDSMGEAEWKKGHGTKSWKVDALLNEVSKLQDQFQPMKEYFPFIRQRWEENEAKKLEPVPYPMTGNKKVDAKDDIDDDFDFEFSGDEFDEYEEEEDDDEKVYRVKDTLNVGSLADKVAEIKMEEENDDNIDDDNVDNNINHQHNTVEMMSI